uniref:5'-nucleotidase n=1 Tax=Photinus pyralis TaxID=7054 RepID=A0A1Y1LV69_PHOPY
MKVISFGILLVINLFLRSVQCENLKLLILHNNDMHSRFEETSRTSGTCKDKSNCYGGFGRVLHVVREARKAAADGTGPPVLFLNAGDTYTGTSWFSVHKWRIAADFMNLLQPDVASLGNHEFDYGVPGLLPFLHAVNFPIVAANLDFSKEPELRATNITKSHVLEISGRKIGVIGYLLPESKELADTEDVIFIDEAVAIREESQRLQREGVNVIIALGHSGFKKDLAIAKEVPLVDVVVGGHTDTFLWNGAQPDLEVPEGPYPTIVKQRSGKQVLVVQPYSFTKYIGRLNVEFDENGDVVGYSGQPQLLSSTVQQEQDALDLLEKYRPDVRKLEEEILGRAKVFLDGTPESCRRKECNLGNLVTDAFVAYHVEHYAGRYWTDAPIGIYNAGAIRNNIEPVNDTIRGGDLLSAFPYNDLVYSMTLSGADLLNTLELGVRSDGETSYGEFLQVSGIRYSFDLTKPVGSRITQAKARCAACSVPTYSPISRTKAYRIITREFIANGGDGHTILKEKGYNKTVEKLNEFEILRWYIKKSPMIFIGEEERIAREGKSFADARIPSAALLILSIASLWWVV